jgi:hypothetical protein
MLHHTNGPTTVRNAGTFAMEHILQRVKGEFLEMPGLRLTDAQAQRLWGLDAQTCSVVLDTLITRRFLFRTHDGAVMRIDGEPLFDEGRTSWHHRL